MTINGLTRIEDHADSRCGEADRATGASVATHPGKAHEQANEVAQLRSALISNRRISMAVGILMRDPDLDEHDAFDVLRRASQTQNRKLREIAEDVIEARRPPLAGRPQQPVV